MILPTWMRGEIAEAWEEYIAQRKKDKKEMTPRSMRGRIKRLDELRSAGHDPLQCLDEAINAHWLDFYAPKDKCIPCAAKKASEETHDYLKSLDMTQEQRAAADMARKRAMGSIRRVA